MIAKISLALLVILNIYILAAISKASRHDIGHNLKLIPSRIKGWFPKIRLDDDKQEQMDTSPSTQRSKMDFSEQCRKGRVKCDGGISCTWFETHPRGVCMKCECSLCMYGVCPPAQKGK